MSELEKTFQNLSRQVEQAISKLNIKDAVSQLTQLQTSSQTDGFWNNSQKAQSIMKQISDLENRTKPWVALQKNLDDINELIKLSDNSLGAELAQQLKVCETEFENLKGQLKLSGKYDGHNALLSIYAGAGGTDAQDWASMLLRMYVRWSESNDMTVNTIDQSSGDEAGLKSVTIEINGNFAYGKLKGEHGVHRLVRLSPFNSDNLRQTSFARVEVMPKIDAPDEVVIDEKDIKIDVFRSGGHGGQSVNTTDSAVRVTHLSTGLVVAIQNERSQLQNKETALTILRSKLAQLQIEQHGKKLSELKGSNEQAAWGNQIRSYVLHPYKQVKDLRTRYETSDIEGVLDGKINPLIDAYLEHSISDES